MSRVRIYARNILANWVGFGANVVAAFLLTPFIVHSLGDTRYGIWSLLVSLSGYLGIIDVGVRASLGRFVTYYLGKNSIRDVNEIYSTANVFFCICGLIVMLASGVISVALPVIFPTIGAQFLPQARIAVLLIGVNMCVGFLAACPRVILFAFERMELSNLVDLLGLGVRVGLTVWVLFLGWGLVALALVQVVMTLVQLVVGYALAYRAFPQMRIGISLASMVRFRELFSFSFFAFLCNAGSQLMVLADMVLITWLLGPVYVAYYSIGVMLVTYAGSMVGLTGGVLAPEVVKHCAREDWYGLHWLLIRGSNMVMFLTIGLYTGLAIFGRRFMHLWMGPSYDISYWVMLLVLIGSMCSAVMLVPGVVTSGLGKIRVSAMLMAVRLVVKIGLSLALVLVLNLGLIGVAVGTMVGCWAVTLLEYRLVLRWVHMSPSRLLAQVIFRWVPLCGGFAVACVLVRMLPLGSGWGGLVLQVAIASAVYLPLAVAVLLPAEDRSRIWNRIGRAIPFAGGG